MILKEQLIKDIETLSPAELMLLQNLVDTLKKSAKKSALKQGPEHKPPKAGYAETRKALASLTGSLSEDIVQAREERL